MKTFLIDWGENCRGARFALIQAKDLHHAVWETDIIGSPFNIAELKLKRNEEEVRYLEIAQPENVFCGVSILDAVEWKHSSEEIFRIWEGA
jgi:hypothetical protein